MVSNGVRLEHVSALASCVTQPLYVSALMGFDTKKRHQCGRFFNKQLRVCASYVYCIYFLRDRKAWRLRVCAFARVCVCLPCTGSEEDVISSPQWQVQG